MGDIRLKMNKQLYILQRDLLAQAENYNEKGLEQLLSGEIQVFEPVGVDPDAFHSLLEERIDQYGLTKSFKGSGADASYQTVFTYEGIRYELRGTPFTGFCVLRRKEDSSADTD